MIELKTVLIVDGSPVARSLLAHLLNGYCGVTVELGSAEEAKIALSRHEDVSLVVVDAEVEGGGLSLLEHIAGLGAERPQVLFLTSRPSLDEETRASLLGTLGYLVKPVSLREILRTLRGFEGRFARALPRRRMAPVARAVVIDPETKAEQITWDICDMSASGALVSSHVAMPAGTRLQLRLQLEDDVIPVEAEVVRAQQPSWGLVPGIGVAFHFEDEERRESLQRFVEGKDE